MNAGAWFWILVVIFAAFNVGGYWVPEPQRHRFTWSVNLFLFVLILLCGWHDFGPPLH